MASLKAIQNKIRSVEKTHTVTKAIEAVSAVKMRKSQERALLGRPYAVSALQILKRASGSISVASHPLTERRDVRKTCFLIVTSDKGLAGSLNSAVVKAVHAEVARRELLRESLVFVTIGTKGREHFEKRGYTALEHYANLSDAISTDDVKAVTDRITTLFTRGEIDECVAFYTNFVSTFEQHAVSRTILPLSLENVTRVVDDITPTKGKYAEQTADDEPTLQYTLEPDADDIMSTLLPFLINIEFYHMLLEAKASEHSARMVAMKNASDKAEELSEELGMQFNKERQSQITREMGEIIGGMEALAA